jgi:hypothetical protein
VKRLLLAMAIALLGGCGSDYQSADLAGIDLGPPSDLSVAPGSIGCVDYVQCLLDCGTDQNCVHACGVAVTPHARGLYRIALTCGQNWCLGLIADGGAGTSCVIQGNMLVDTTPGSMDCELCLANSLALLFGQPCTSADDPNCDPQACAAAYGACLNDH